jgi:hypothetical protein
MNLTKAFVVAVVLCCSMSVMSQQVDATMQQGASATTSGSQINQSSGASAHASRQGASAQGSGSASNSTVMSGSGSGSGPANSSAADQMTAVHGELVGKLDSKRAKVGDPVIVKTTEKARTAEGIEIPKGSRLIGHVTDVQAHGSGNQDSHLGLEFDRAELKNGRAFAIHSMLESVAPARGPLGERGADPDDLFASAPAGNGGLGGGRSGGGVVGGGRALIGGGGAVAGRSVNSVGSAGGDAGANVGSTTDGALDATGSTAVHAGDGTLRGAAAGSGSLATHATEIPGVMLGGNASGEASGMLSASKKNVHLDSGTQVVLGISSAVGKQP